MQRKRGEKKARGVYEKKEVERKQEICKGDIGKERGPKKHAKERKEKKKRKRGRKKKKQARGRRRRRGGKKRLPLTDNPAAPLVAYKET